MVWQSIPAQLEKENKKFFYGSLKIGARAKDFELAIQWLADAGRVFPIEVMAEVNVKSKSFKFFCEKYKPQLALRFSLKDFKEEPWMTNLPLYAVEYAF